MLAYDFYLEIQHIFSLYLSKKRSPTYFQTGSFNHLGYVGKLSRVTVENNIDKNINVGYVSKPVVIFQKGKGVQI